MANTTNQRLPADFDLPDFKLQDDKLVKSKPYAFIRFGNEIITIKQSLESILGFTDRGIICYHEFLPGTSSDGSIKVVQEFVRKNPGFRLVKYPLPVIYQDCQYLKNNINQADRFWLLDAFYNFALLNLIELAKENGDYDTAYIFKHDCDHIYYAPALQESYEYLLKHQDQLDLVVYSKYNVARDLTDRRTFWQKLCKKKNPTRAYIQRLVNAEDHWLAKLDRCSPYIFIYSWDKNNPEKGYNAWERADWKEDTSTDINLDFITSYHFFFEKFARESGMENFHQKVTLKAYPKDIRPETGPFEGIPENLVKSHWYQSTFSAKHEFWGKEHIEKIIDSFDYSPRTNSGRTQVDFDELFDNPKYRMSHYLAQFNKQLLDPNNTREQQKELNRQAKILKQLIQDTQWFEQYTALLP